MCGRNRYIIALPEDGINEAQVLFSTDRSHRESGVPMVFSVFSAVDGTEKMMSKSLSTLSCVG